MKVKSESEVDQSCRLFVTAWTAAYQAPPSMGFSRQEYCSGVPLPSPLDEKGDILNSGYIDITFIYIITYHIYNILRASQVALVVKNPLANAGDARDSSLIPGLGRSPGGGHGNPRIIYINIYYPYYLYHVYYSYRIQHIVKVKSLSRVRLFVTPWSVAYQAPPSMGFSKQEYWSGLPFPSPDLPNPGIKPRSPALQADALPPEPSGKHVLLHIIKLYVYYIL